jgi:hypothetical protein
MKSELELITEVAKSWNNLNISFLEPILAEDFVYNSQWVFDEMKGKQAYLKYISGKFLAIIEGIEKKGNKIIAEIGYCTYGYPGKPCIVLTQTTYEKIQSVTLLIEAENNVITKMDLCGVPAPETAKLTGIIPK